MKPKNSKDRRASFLKFLALFAITITAILFAVYFNFKVPNKENALLKDQVKAIEKEMAFQDSFANEIKAIRGKIDSLSITGANLAYQNSLIGARLAELQNTIPTKDSTYRYDMYTNIISVYADLLDGKIQLNQLKDSKATIDEYKTALDKARADLKQSERDLYIARNSN